MALTSTGTGAGNAAGSMIEALTAGSRVLHVTGQIESEFLTPEPASSSRGVIHEFPRQRQMLDAVSAYAATITDAKDAEAELEAAIGRVLSAPQGPASVEWPTDLQYLASPDEQRAADTRIARPPAPNAAALDRAAAVLASAERPLLWLGGGAAGAGDELRALAHRLGAGILTSNSGRGIVSEDDDLVVGNFAASPEVAGLLADADVLLAVGTHFRSNETKSYHLALPATQVQIDVDPPRSAGCIRPRSASSPTPARHCAASSTRSTAPAGATTGRPGSERCASAAGPHSPSTSAATPRSARACAACCPAGPWSPAT